MEEPHPRRSLCIGVSTFGPAAGGADDEEPDLSPFGELDYAAGYTAQLHAALTSAGYRGDLVTDPGQLSAVELGALVERHTDGGGVAVVHVLSHGDHDDEGGVFVVGSDGRRARRTLVEDWRIQVAADPAAPTTLFLLDALQTAGDRLTASCRATEVRHPFDPQAPWGGAVGMGGSWPGAPAEGQQ